MIEIKGKCIIRTYSAGVFFGKVEEREGKEVLLKNARRLWRWAGAATLSELSKKGTSLPENCKFPCSVKQLFLTEVIEIIPCTEEAIKSIEGVEVWTAH